MKINQTKRKAIQTIQKNAGKLETKAKKYPVLSLIVLMILFVTTVAAGAWFRTEEVTPQDAPQPVPVSVYRIGEAPRVSVFATVEKTGVITIAAQTPGIVQNVAVSAGDEVRAGKTVVSLASNYYGGNALSVQRRIAQLQLDSLEDTFPQEMELLQKQRTLAEKVDANADELRDIQEKSIQETKDVIALNEDIIAQYDDIIESSTVSAEVRAAQQAKSQYASATNQLRQALRQAEYQSDGENPPAAISNSQKDITLSQLALQEKALKLNKELTTLQLQLARVQEAQMYPGTPFAGTVERVHVRKGQQVNPGTPLVTLYCDTLETVLTASVPKNIASQVSLLEASEIITSTESITVFPSYISQVPTSGDLYTIEFSLTAEQATQLSDKSVVEVSIPVGYQDTGATVPFVPVDAVHIAQDSAEVFVVEDEVVSAKPVILGEIQGTYILVKEGLSVGDQVIKDRFVVPGDAVTVREQ